MRPALKVLFAALGLLLLLAIGVFIFGVITVRRAYPQTDGVLQVPGLDAPVEIYRDNYGIPHIYASTTHDLFYAQGFVHAQDRFWQMEFWRRVGSGRLSEILGSGALGQDKFIRTLGWHRVAQQEAELLDGELLAALEAYSEGVNNYMSLRQGRLGLEFSILALTGVRYDPEPWTLVNSLTWAKFMAWDLGGNMENELTRAQIAVRLGSSAINTLMPAYPSEYPLIVSHLPSEAAMNAVPNVALDFHPLGSGPDIGSNSWAVAGSMTDTGMPYLANDPHLGIRMPSIWYEIGLHCQPKGPDCPYDVTGVSFASAPGVIIGHNDRIAWGFTNLGPDVQDLYIERINPDNPDQYEYLGEWLDMEHIREEIAVAGEDEPVVIDVRLTRHGPIINDVVGGVEEEWSFGWEPLALRWTALEPNTIVSSILMLNRAQNWDDFREALRFFDVPSQNVIYADVDGNIGYQAPGRIPIRASGDGSLPVPGWTAAYEWVDYIPFDELPRSYNPPAGFIVTANHAVVDNTYPYFISMDWAPGYRARRIHELIEGTDLFTIDVMADMQADSSPIYAQDVLPYLLDLTPSGEPLISAVELLRVWDGQAHRDSAGAALFETMRLKMVDHVFVDELGEQLLQRMRGSLMTALLQLLPDPTSTWFDDTTTPEHEDRNEILERALRDAVADLQGTLGADMNNWRWGALHTASFENETLGQSGIGPIEALFNRGPVPVDGAIATINNTGYSSSNPFGVVTVPSFRQIVDLQDLSRSLSMHTTGQSGHPFNPHYDDMIDPWRNIEYHAMLWTRDQVIDAAEATLTLTPGAN
jgi:penicillin amidase